MSATTPEPPGTASARRDPLALSGLLASRVQHMRSSAIRDLLRVAAQDGIISLAGGLPAEEAFPLDELRAASATLDAGTLQYSTTEGSPALRRWIADMVAAAAARPISPEQVLITSGSQQGLDLLGRVLIETGDVVAIDDPAYLGALQALGLFQPGFVPVPTDADGMDVDALEAILRAGRRVKVVYTVTNFSNPAGGTLSLARRKALGALADRYGFLVVEDDPYGLLRFADAPPLPPVSRFTDRCVSLGTFSKTVVPGLRVGWTVGDAALVATLARAKQGCDLHTSTLSQHLVLSLVGRSGWLEEHTGRLARRYALRSAALCDALEETFGGDVLFDRPRGGLFCWARLPSVDTRDLLREALAGGVAFVPGAEFAPVAGQARHRDALRLSFAGVAEDRIADGVHRLGAAVASLSRPPHDTMAAR